MGTPGHATLLNDLFIPTASGNSRNDGTSENVGPSIVSLTLPGTQAQEDTVNEMWTIYMEEVKKSDERSTNSWKEDANGIIIFVSLTLPSPPSPRIDKLED
jgi:hypothetical protein